MRSISGKVTTAKHRMNLAVFIFAAIGGVLYGYDLGIISGALLFIDRDIPMTVNQTSFLVAAVFGGGSIATLASGFLSDWLGRRLMILLSAFIFIISVFIVVFAQSYDMLLFGRLVQGVGVGVITIVVPLYLTESMPTALRGRGVTAFQLLLTLGIFLASLVGLFFTSSGDWRGMFSTALVPGMIMFVGCFFLSDSPRWLAMKGRFDQAYKVLKKTRCTDDARRELVQMRNAVESGRQGFDSAKINIWQRRYMVPICLVFAIAILQQLTGINSLLQLSSVILKEAGLKSNIVDMLGTNAIMGLNFVMTIVAISLVDKLERRTLMSFGTGGIVLSLIFCACVFGFMSEGVDKGFMLLAGVLGFIFFYAVGPGALVWAVLSELLPSKVRSRGLAIALFLNSLTSSIFASIFLGMASHIGYAGVFCVSGFFTLLYFIVCFWLIPKTKGKSLEDIEEQFAVSAH
jgi:SP family galactose:H+ symporter-like MFS transporter